MSLRLLPSIFIVIGNWSTRIVVRRLSSLLVLCKENTFLYHLKYLECVEEILQRPQFHSFLCKQANAESLVYRKMSHLCTITQDARLLLTLGSSLCSLTASNIFTMQRKVSTLLLSSIYTLYTLPRPQSHVASRTLSLGAVISSQYSIYLLYTAISFFYLFTIQNIGLLRARGDIK